MHSKSQLKSFWGSSTNVNLFDIFNKGLPFTLRLKIFRSFLPQEIQRIFLPYCYRNLMSWDEFMGSTISWKLKRISALPWMRTEEPRKHHTSAGVIEWDVSDTRTRRGPINQHSHHSKASHSSFNQQSLGHCVNMSSKEVPPWLTSGALQSLY